MGSDITIYVIALQAKVDSTLIKWTIETHAEVRNVVER